MLRLLAWLLLVLHMCILTLSNPFADAAAREVAVAPLLVRRCRNWSAGGVTALRAHNAISRKPHLQSSPTYNCHGWGLLSGVCCNPCLTSVAYLSLIHI